MGEFAKQAHAIHNEQVRPIGEINRPDLYLSVFGSTWLLFNLLATFFNLTFLSFAQVLSRTVSDHQVVEETLMTLTHKDTISWLLPSVRPTGKEINVALVCAYFRFSGEITNSSSDLPSTQVTFMEFNQDGKIVNKRVYWDQASVLRQIGVLPKSLYCRSNSSEVVLPIVGSEVASSMSHIFCIMDY